MSAIGLAHPEWAPAVLSGVLALAVAALVATARTRRRLRRLLGARAPRAAGGARDALLLVALAAIGVAALGPTLGERTSVVTSSGVDVVLLLDVSRSMAARDLAPTRLARARRAAEEVLARLEPGDRAALAAFAGRGVLLTPLTPDLDALADMLPSIDTDLMRAQGSRLGEGVRAALAAFEPASPRPRVLLVLSDGEDPNPASLRDAGAAEASRAGVRVLAAAFGTAAGAAVPDGDVPLRDGEGRLVHSRADPARLARLAQATGGMLLETGPSGALRLDLALPALRRDAPRTAGEPVLRRVPAVRVLPFAALAFLLLGAEAAGVGSGRHAGASPRPRPLASWSRQIAGAGLAVMLVAGPSDAGAPSAPDAAREESSLEPLAAGLRSQPHDPRLLLRLGVARARADRHEEAAIAFLEAALYSRDPDTAALAYYDLGVTSLEAGALERARDAFFDALALAPHDRRAQFNLEWTLRALEARPPSAPRGGGAPPAGAGEERTGREARAGGDGAKAAAPAREAETGSAAPAVGDSGGGERRPAEATGRDARAAAQSPPGTASAASGALRGEIPRLGPDEVQRWLAAAVDDPGRGLREAARRAAPPHAAAEPGEPAW